MLNPFISVLCFTLHKLSLYDLCERTKCIYNQHLNYKMKGQSPFDTSDVASNPKNRQSPSKEASHRAESGELPQEMQYRLEKMFEQAGQREERYISIIKEQESKINKHAEQYLQNLREIKKEFIDFMQLKKVTPKKMNAYSIQQTNFGRKKQKTKLNSKLFSLKTKAEMPKEFKEEDSYEKELYLACKMHCYYYTPFAEDYIREIIPESMLLKVRTVYPNQELSLEIKIVKEEDEYSNIRNLIQKIPFQISTAEQKAIIFQFQIPCELQAINYFKNRQFQLQLVNKKGMFVYAYANINLSSLLYYEDQPTSWNLAPVAFYSAFDGKKVGEMAIKLQNKLQRKEKNQHYKIESSKPLQIKGISSQINYNDEESRMIQRISKFKTSTNSLLLGIGTTRQADAQKYFQRENDKIILNHRKKKELDSIQQYKNSHKQQLMSKLFNDAINRYYLTECQIGNPKYIVFNHLNKQRQHKKISYKVALSLSHQSNSSPKNALLVIGEHINVNVINPNKFKSLMEKDLIQISTQCNYEYDLDQGQQSMWVMSGMWHPIVLRAICFPPKTSLLNKQNLQATYDLTLTLFDDYDRQIENYQTKLVLRLPNVQRKLYFHSYFQTESQVQLPFDEEKESFVSKSLITNQNSLQYSWDKSESRLKLNFKHRAIGDHQFYVIVNDSDHLYQIGCYLLVAYTYPKLNHKVQLALGQVQKLKLDFSMDEKTIAQNYKEISEKSQAKTNISKEQVRVVFGSSKPEHCYVRCQNEEEMICKLNKIYEVQARIQTFNEDVNPQKIIIHALDADRNVVIKKWLIQIEKEEKIQYKSVYKLYCQHGKLLKYKFQLRNEDAKEKSFRLYSSNLSILIVPMELVSLISNQTVTLELQFLIKQAIPSQKLGSPLRVVLTVSEGSNFANYLFELTIKVR